MVSLLYFRDIQEYLMINSDYDFSRISITAQFVAYYRQFSDILFARDVADFLQSYDAIQDIDSKLQIQDELQRQQLIQDSSIYAPLLVLRYKSINELFNKSNIKQILELASGFSLRGLAVSRSPEISSLEF